MPTQTILTDIDGVVLDWEEGFSVWMEHHGHKKVEGYQFMYNIGARYGMTAEQGSKMVKQFNESAAIGFLPPLRDAQHYIKLLHERHRIDFVAITSLSLDPYAGQLRERNLKKLCGTAFKKVVCLDTGADKEDILKEYARVYPGAIWIEDKPENALAGHDQGLDAVLMEHGHNMNDPLNHNFRVARNWQDIYAYVTKAA